jgi:hypothetical protein
MSLRHLKSNYVDTIALQLDEDVYGASGDFNDREIRERLMQAIIKQCDLAPRTPRQYSADLPVLSLEETADLILGVWEYMDRMQIEAVFAGAALEKERHEAKLIELTKKLPL